VMVLVRSRLKNVDVEAREAGRCEETRGVVESLDRLFAHDERCSVCCLQYRERGGRVPTNQRRQTRPSRRRNRDRAKTS
jgi:hypothetical protein